MLIIFVGIGGFQVEGLCTVAVTTSWEKDTGTWGDLWLAAVAVKAMCVDRGFIGVSTHHGKLI